MQNRDKTDKDADVGHDFAEFLAGFAFGSVNEQATERLREVIAACRRNGGKGSVTIKLNVAAKGDLAALAFKVSATSPAPDLPGQTLWAAEDGALSKSDPRQMKLGKVLDAPRVVQIKEGQ